MKSYKSRYVEIPVLDIFDKKCIYNVRKQTYTVSVLEFGITD